MKEGRRRVRVQDAMTEAEVGAMKSMALKVEGVHEPRDAGDLQQLEKARKETNCLGKSQKDCPLESCRSP